MLLFEKPWSLDANILSTLILYLPKSSQDKNYILSNRILGVV